LGRENLIKPLGTTDFAVVYPRTQFIRSSEEYNHKLNLEFLLLEPWKAPNLDVNPKGPSGFRPVNVSSNKCNDVSNNNNRKK